LYEFQKHAGEKEAIWLASNVHSST